MVPGEGGVCVGRHQQLGAGGGCYDGPGGAVAADGLSYDHAPGNFSRQAQKGLAQALLGLLRDLVGHGVVHAPGGVRVDRHAAAMDGAERHAPHRGGGEGEFEQVVARSVQFQCHHHSACQT
ncbi:hypothetical protein GCM10010307_32490 [Streptomyces vastus]|uniref:Uncharacterized protein n=1 Tax=Streptomyces vastus TaxID=285451 RepID=A0ABN3QUZ0_9ACTN